MANMRGNIEQIVTNTKTIGGYRCGQGIDDALMLLTDISGAGERGLTPDNITREETRRLFGVVVMNAGKAIGALKDVRDLFRKSHKPEIA